MQARPSGAGTWLRRQQFTDFADECLETDPCCESPEPLADADQTPGGQTPSGLFRRGMAVERPCVLLVDDDPALLALTALFAEMAGYQALTAPNGVAALRLIADGHAVVAIVSDYTMPGMNGGVFLKEAAKLRPGVLGAIVTAHTDISILSDIPPGVDVLLKPFRRLQFVAQLNRLAGPRQSALALAAAGALAPC